MATSTFNPNQHLISLKGKDYLPVQWRLVWFREQCPQGTITTEMVYCDYEKGFCVFRAEITNGLGGSATATKQESIKDFRDFIEKAETGAVGRALAMLGFGTQFVAEEFEEGERLADAPALLAVRKPEAYPAPQPVMQEQQFTEVPVSTPRDKMATKEQISAITRICETKRIMLPPVDLMSYDAAKNWILVAQQAATLPAKKKGHLGFVEPKETKNPGDYQLNRRAGFSILR